METGNNEMTAYPRIIAACVVSLLLPGLAHASLSSPIKQMQVNVPLPVKALSARIALPNGSIKAPVLLAQAGDNTFRLGQLEERVRDLTGKLEEQNFILLEMQERMRQMQEDNEFRFQEIESKGSDRSDAGEGVPTEKNSDVTVVAQPDEANDPSASSGSLGTVTFDQDGNLVDGPAAEQQDITQDPTKTASLPKSGPARLYATGYNHILTGDYAQAEAAFAQYVAEYPQGEQVSDAHFWLGEAQYGQTAYHQAAKTLLSAHKQFPESPKAPEMLLKLGMSLAALDNRDTACATYREVLTRYPGSSEAVKNKVAVEQSRMSC